MPVAEKEISKEELRQQRIALAEAKGYRYTYGSLFPPVYDVKGNPRGRMPDWMVEAHCCRATQITNKMAIAEGQKPKEYQGFAYHLRRFIEIIWGPENPVLPYQWNPNAELIFTEVFNGETPRFVGIAGNKSSSKTQTIAIIAVALFLVNPFKTKCIATSYTIQTGDDKIFGVIKVMWQAACSMLGEANMPGRLKPSDHKIVLVHPDGFVDDTKGIELIAGEQAKSKKSSARLQGIKAEYIFVAADELATLSHAIVKTCKENLATANKNVWVVGSFNPDHYYDGSMEMAKPIDGWDSINVEFRKWRTLLGVCLHLDGLYSPNVVAGYEKWKGLYTREQLMKDKEWYGGEKTHGFWQMIRAFWSPTGSSDAIYSGQEIETYHADRPCGTGWYWADTPVLLAGHDPSFRPGGDRAVAYLGKCGQAIFEDGTRRKVFEFVEYEVLAEDVTKGQDKPRQVAEGFKAFCESRGVRIENAAVDVTGAAAYASLLRAVWGDGFLEIIFSESASDSPISETEQEAASERYANRSAEVWYSAKPMMRSQQIKGIHPDMADEMCNRTYREVNGKIVIEKKEDMKARTGKSPDISDAGFCCLDLARQRHGLASSEVSRGGSSKQMSNDQFREWAEQITGVKCQYLEFEG